MPWNSPSSQPTSWACAIRSSASDGTSSPNGRVMRSSSSISSGARPSSSSLIERRWISASLVRPASSNGALRTSSRSCLIMEAIRMTLPGCSTRSAGSRASSLSPGLSATPIPSWETTTPRRRWLSSAEPCCSSRDVFMVPILHRQQPDPLPPRRNSLDTGPWQGCPASAQRHTGPEHVAFVLEPQRLLLQPIHELGQLSSRCLTLSGQTLELEDLPEPQHRVQDLVLVLAQVVDALDGHLDGLALKAGNTGARHFEVLDDIEDRDHSLVRRDLQGCVHQVAVEDHVQVLVGRDAAEQALAHRVVGELASIAVGDAGGQLLQRDISEGAHEFPGVRCLISRGPKLHPETFQRNGIHHV